MEYLPFGELLVDEHKNSYNSPFKYNGKEFDKETGNYFYGTRYYDPKWSIFISVDPLAEKYPSISSYAYVANNPINAIDPDGREIRFVVKGENGNRYLKYENGQAYWTDTGKRYDGTGTNKTISLVIASYRLIERSGDVELINMLKTLEKSDLIHFVHDGEGGGRSYVQKHTNSLNTNGDRAGTNVIYDFSEKRQEEFVKSTGTPFSVFGIVAHESQHQFDYDLGNIADFIYPSSAESPQEIRAVYMENRARVIENGSNPNWIRTKYGGIKIDPIKLKKPPNYEEKK